MADWKLTSRNALFDLGEVRKEVFCAISGMYSAEWVLPIPASD